MHVCMFDLWLIAWGHYTKRHKSYAKTRCANLSPEKQQWQQAFAATIAGLSLSALNRA